MNTIFEVFQFVTSIFIGVGLLIAVAVLATNLLDGRDSNA